MEEGTYDCEANLSLLKLYQLNPDKFKEEVVVQVLLKGLMALPDSDMTLCKSLIDAAHFEVPFPSSFSSSSLASDAPSSMSSPELDQ